MAPPARWVMGPNWGGHNSLDPTDHRALARWAADCAEHVLPIFEGARPDDDRPWNAIEATRAWARDEVTVSRARAIALATHPAAREVEGTAPREAARAAGHAVASAHVDGHAVGAANYAIEAAAATAPDDDDAADGELEWQRGRLPAHLRSVVILDPGTG